MPTSLSPLALLPPNLGEKNVAVCPETSWNILPHAPLPPQRPHRPLALSPGEEISAGHLVDLGLSGGEHPVRTLYVQFPAAIQQVSRGVRPPVGKWGRGLRWAWDTAPSLENNVAVLCHAVTLRFHPVVINTRLEQSSLPRRIIQATYFILHFLVATSWLVGRLASEGL